MGFMIICAWACSSSLLRYPNIDVQLTEEASRLRFRPILMTAFSTIFGVMPLAFASGPGAASRVSIGMSVMGGMLVSTVLSLYVVPVFYVMAKGLQLGLFPKSAQDLADGDQISNGYVNENSKTDPADGKNQDSVENLRK